MADSTSNHEQQQQPDWLYRIWLVQLWGVHNSYAQSVLPNTIGRIPEHVTIEPLEGLRCLVLDWKIASKELTRCYKQMMFVSGETADASTETTGLIEEIVRAQVIEMVSLLHFLAKDTRN